MEGHSIIKLELDGLSSEETHKLREILDVVVASGSLMTKNGKVILNFDHEGVLQEIEIQVKKYRRKSLTSK